MATYVKYQLATEKMVEGGNMAPVFRRLLLTTFPYNSLCRHARKRLFKQTGPLLSGTIHSPVPIDLQ